MENNKSSVEPKRASKPIPTSSSPQRAKPSPPSSSYGASFGLLKTIVYALVILCGVIAISASIFVNSAYSDASEKIYVLSEKGTTVAHATLEGPESRVYELRNHAKLFVTHMFAFTEDTYEKNIEYALNLIGSEGKQILFTYEKANMFGTLVKTNAKVEVVIDSVLADAYSDPYRVKLYGRQIFKSPGGTRTHYLWALMSVEDTEGRNDINVHGLKIKHFEIVNNNQITE